eukprot:7486348-Lingulodinium_polyedra.AAC.1
MECGTVLNTIDTCCALRMKQISARVAQKCVQKRIPLLRRCAFRKTRAPCADHHMMVDAWSARFANCAAPQQ